MKCESTSSEYTSQVPSHSGSDRYAMAYCNKIGYFGHMNSWHIQSTAIVTQASPSFVTCSTEKQERAWNSVNDIGGREKVERTVGRLSMYPHT